MLSMSRKATIWKDASNAQATFHLLSHTGHRAFCKRQLFLIAKHPQSPVTGFSNAWWPGCPITGVQVSTLISTHNNLTGWLRTTAYKKFRQKTHLRSTFQRLPSWKLFQMLSGVSVSKSSFWEHGNRSDWLYRTLWEKIWTSSLLSALRFCDLVSLSLSNRSWCKGIRVVIDVWI